MVEGSSIQSAYSAKLSTSHSLRRVAGKIDPAELDKQDNLRYAVVPIEWLRAVQPIDPRDRPSSRDVPADMIEALEGLISAVKSGRELSLDQELALRAAAWPTPAVF